MKKRLYGAIAVASLCLALSSLSVKAEDGGDLEESGNSDIICEESIPKASYDENNTNHDLLFVVVVGVVIIGGFGAAMTIIKKDRI